MWITVAFSSPPVSGLTPTITIYDVATDAVLVASDPMPEIATSGVYKYNFIPYDPLQTYTFICDGGGTLPVASRYVISRNESYIEDIKFIQNLRFPSMGFN